MIIAITSAGQVELRDAENFRAFKVVDATGGSLERVAQCLSGLATLTDDGKAAWVVPDRLTQLAGDLATDTWRASLAQMISAARKFGWVNEANGTIRAHIEVVGRS